MIYVLSGTNAYAFITVTYPAGSTLTCTSGSTTLNAKTTTGSYVFCVPQAGTWTVKATSGTNTASKSVSITSRWQSESVTLSYELRLLDNGVIASGYSFAYQNGSFKDGRIALESHNMGDAGGGCSTEQTIDCSRYKTCVFHKTTPGSYGSQYYGVYGLCTGYNPNYIGGNGPGASGWDACGFVAYFLQLNGQNLNITETKDAEGLGSVFTVDLSSLNGNYYFKLSNYGGNDYFDSIIFYS